MGPETKIEVRRLEKGDDRSRFASGNEELDAFFRKYAKQNQFRYHVGVSYVAVREDEITGYATIAPAQLDLSLAPEEVVGSLPWLHVPALRLARLAVQRAEMRQGIGSKLLRKVCALAWELAEKFGCVGIVVDAKPESISYYEQYGFHEISLEEGDLPSSADTVSLFIALKSVSS